MIDRVTITGADDSIRPEELVPLTREFPFVEWGILISSSSQGKARFPSLTWLAELYSVFQSHPHMILSFHVCGKWVREICAGNWTPLFTNIGPILDFGKRVQLNFHTYSHLLSDNFVSSAISRSREHGWQIIFQCDGVNDHLVSNAYDDGLDAVPLYDKSGGAGIVPKKWPRAMRGIYSGYAGGLGPDNLATEINAIAAAADGERYWIDMETRVRSDDDRRFDLDKVKLCLEIGSKFVAIPQST